MSRVSSRALSRHKGDMRAIVGGTLVVAVLMSPLVPWPDDPRVVEWDRQEQARVIERALVGDDDGNGVIFEDESGFDCRTMGNRVCGVQVEGDTYLIWHDADGNPVSVTERP